MGLLGAIGHHPQQLPLTHFGDQQVAVRQDFDPIQKKHRIIQEPGGCDDRYRIVRAHRIDETCRAIGDVGRAVRGNGHVVREEVLGAKRQGASEVDHLQGFAGVEGINPEHGLSAGAAECPEVGVAHE